MNSIQDIAQAMVAKGKGILAADESTPTCTKRFESINVESTAKTVTLTVTCFLQQRVLKIT